MDSRESWNVRELRLLDTGWPYGRLFIDCDQTSEAPAGALRPQSPCRNALLMGLSLIATVCILLTCR